MILNVNYSLQPQSISHNQKNILFTWWHQTWEVSGDFPTCFSLTLVSLTVLRRNNFQYKIQQIPFLPWIIGNFICLTQTNHHRIHSYWDSQKSRKLVSLSLSITLKFLFTVVDQFYKMFLLSIRLAELISQMQKWLELVSLDSEQFEYKISFLNIVGCIFGCSKSKLFLSILTDNTTSITKLKKNFLTSRSKVWNIVVAIRKFENTIAFQSWLLFPLFCKSV